MAKRKARALTRSTRQTGKSNMARDRKRKALAPGKRRSKKGNIYYENRKNRSDVKGRDTPGKYRKKKVVRTVTKYKLTLTPERKMRAYKQYKKNEENNYHTENALMLIRLFGTPTQLKKAMQIKRNRDKRGSILKSEQDWLYKYGHSHYNKIKPTSVKRITKKRTRGAVEEYNMAKIKLYKQMGAKSWPPKEPLRGVRRHDLLPKALRAKIPPLYSQDGKKDPIVYAKFFSPYSQYTFYITEFDGKDTLFGYVSNGQGSEWGYSSFKELVTANRRGLPLIERDKYFSPKKASKIPKIKRLKR